VKIKNKEKLKRRKAGSLNAVGSHKERVFAGRTRGFNNTAEMTNAPRTMNAITRIAQA
jgi:hypothetical protein